MGFRRHHDLEIWQDGMALVETVYALTEAFPDRERFGLSAQLRRAAVSVPSNIAEGCARDSKKGLINFVRIARGSLAEVETQVTIARRLKFCNENPALDDLIEKLFAKMNRFLNSVTEG